MGPSWVPFGDPCFVWGPFSVPFGDPFLRDEFRGIGRGPETHLEAEGRLIGGLGAEPPGIAPILAYFGIFWLRVPKSNMLKAEN